MADANTPAGTKRKRLQDGDDILPAVKKQDVSEALLVRRLTEHVERIDMDAALQYQMQLGISEGTRQVWLLYFSALEDPVQNPVAGCLCCAGCSALRWA